LGKEDSTDVLMKFEPRDSGTPIESDCATNVGTKSALLEGFTSADHTKFANFFEIDDIDISIELKPDNAFAADKKWNLDLGDVTIDRTVDRASPLLMHAALTATPFKSATIVKRRAGGGERSGRAYLRIDYTDVLITKISWSDSELVKEKLTFIYRGLKVQYRLQDQNGKLIGNINYQLQR
jgi:type VI protein secretion system component Hcp